jgi:hypothetical protein
MLAVARSTRRQACQSDQHRDSPFRHQKLLRSAAARTAGRRSDDAQVVRSCTAGLASAVVLSACLRSGCETHYRTMSKRTT